METIAIREHEVRGLEGLEGLEARKGPEVVHIAGNEDRDHSYFDRAHAIHAVSVRIPKRLLRNDRRGATSEFYPTLNMSEMARRIGCSGAGLSNILRGKRTGSVDLLKKIAKELGVSMEKLFALQAEARAVTQTPGKPPTPTRRSRTPMTRRSRKAAMKAA